MAILREKIHSGDFIGMALIGLGLMALDGRLLALFKRRPLSAVAD
jgi:hypothetical protein